MSLLSLFSFTEPSKSLCCKIALFVGVCATESGERTIQRTGGPDTVSMNNNTFTNRIRKSITDTNSIMFNSIE